MTSQIFIIKTLSTPHINTNSEIVYWKLGVLIEFLIILFLIFKNYLNRKISARREFKNESINQDVDFDNIFNSSFNSKGLYDELKVKYHPDRFAGDEEKQEIADAIFKEITKNKNNAKRLIELKNEAANSLNLTF